VDKVRLGLVTHRGRVELAADPGRTSLAEHSARVDLVAEPGGEILVAD